MIPRRRVMFELLEAVGETISELVLRSNIILRIGDAPDHYIRIEGPARLALGRQDPVEVVYAALRSDRPSESGLTELAAVIGRRIGSARVFADGGLELKMESDIRLEVAALESFEAWTYVVGNSVLASPPGGFDEGL
jgi:hypothetical protein